MKFCKVCDCGNIVVFEDPLGFPPKCPKCPRFLDGFATFPEGDPGIEIRLNEVRKRLADEEAGQRQEDVPDSSCAGYCLKLISGEVIPIPDEGCIIGRTATGGEELAGYGSVSRQHVRITPKGHGVLVEDLSTYGTWVNGKKLEKNVPEGTAAGSTIMLCDLETTLEYR